MRILHVVRQFAPGIGGLENYVGELARAQREAGHAPTVLTLDRVFSDPATRLPALEHTEACEVRRIPYLGSHRYPIAPSVFAKLRDYDIIHVHGVDFFFDALAWSGFWHNRPLVATTHGGYFHTPYAQGLKKAFFRTVTRRSIRSYGAVLACSKSDRDLFATISKRPVELVENGVDVDKFAGRSSAVFRKHIISIGRFASHKRLDRLLDFLAAVRAKDAGWTMTLAGVEWDVKTAALMREARARGLSDCVSVRTGLSNAEIASEIEQASFVASASDYEGFGIAIVEGMSAGLIPLMNDIPPFRTLHERAPIGLVLDFADAAKSAGQFVRAAGVFAENHAALRARAQEVAGRYSWSAVSRRIGGIYERVIGEHERKIFGVPVLVATSDDAIKRLDDEV